ncbi:hypothetical protein PF011_g26835 [Phytophthora fragariae]|uniref:Ankyrin repeat-containing domain n=1 Tax=Phytophthora fragariae TaxID=53985 RepID=A0A6A3HLY6_9STRA|nr:hypothetical protein PF011_g26835 [Phytophthora fragariae]
MMSEGAAPRGTERRKIEAIPLLTVVRLVVGKCIHARGIEMEHVSLSIDDFLNQLPREWSLDEAYKRTGSLRCMQYLAARGPKVLVSYYQSWITNNAAEMALKRGDIEALKWLAEEYAPRVSITRAAKVAAGDGRLDVLEWSYRNHRDRVEWGGAECAARQGYLKYLHANCAAGCTSEAMSAAAANGHLNVVRWLKCNHPETCTPSALNKAIAGGRLDVAMFLHHEQGLKCSLRSDVLLRGLRLEVVEWLLATCRDELEHGTKFQVARCDWHFNEWMRAQAMEIVEQNDSRIVWMWNPRT